MKQLTLTLLISQLGIFFLLGMVTSSFAQVHIAALKSTGNQADHVLVEDLPTGSTHTQLTPNSFNSWFEDGDPCDDVVNLNIHVMIFPFRGAKKADISWANLSALSGCGVGIYYEDPHNLQDLLSTLDAEELKKKDGPANLISVSNTVDVLTENIPNETPTNDAFVNSHIRFNEDQFPFPSDLDDFLVQEDNPSGERVVGLYGTINGGRAVFCGLDNTFHGDKDGNGRTRNHYDLLLNIVEWVADQTPANKPVVPTQSTSWGEIKESVEQ